MSAKDGAEGSALVSLPTRLQEEIQKLIRAAWSDGFDAEHAGAEDFFDGFAIADDLLTEPRRVCCKCSSRLCDGEEDEMCRECWDASIARANATREERIASGWTLGPDGGLHPPTAPEVKPKAYGEVCPGCGEQIYDNQEIVDTEDGMAHGECVK